MDASFKHFMDDMLANVAAAVGVRRGLLIESAASDEVKLLVAQARRYHRTMKRFKLARMPAAQIDFARDMRTKLMMAARRERAKG